MIAAALLLVLGFMLSATTTISGDSISYSCDISSNYTDNSSYLANLKLLPTMLIQNASTNPSPFSMGCIGTVPDIVYGLFLCRGDVGEFDCKNCTATGFQDAQQLCWLNKDATVFYDQCLVYFSNTDFLDDVSSLGVDVGVIKRSMDGVLPGYDPNRPGNITHTNGIIKVLLQETAKQAAYNSTWRFATALMNAINLPPLYSLMQCVPYLTPSECWECLNNISEVALSRQAGYQFWPPFAPSNQILAVPCNLRYSTAQFYEGEPLLRIWSSPNADMAPVVMPNSPEHKRSKRKILVTAFVVPPLASIFCLILYFGFIRKHINGSRKRANMNLKEDEDLVWGLEGMSSEFTVYNFSQVQEATGNFSEENKLGQGGFGPVYKGQFPDGLEIAVKRLASHSGQGFTEFKNEIQLIAKLQHTNLVRLLGCCSQGEEKTLVYEYLPNKSLDFFIFDETRRSLLDWTTRRSIIEGIAQGLLYLHKHSRLRVIHRDLKTSNILLDHEMNPKISDFGLAKMFSTNETEGNTKRIVGTYGYMAPEYASEGLFSVKSDVFSFGVLILEIISGKRTSSFHGYGDFINLLGHAWQLWRDGLWLQLMDTSLVTEYHTLQMMRCINIALLCVQENVVDRPTMSHVVSMLSSESMSLPEPKHPAYFHIRVATEEISTVVQPSSLNELTVSALTGR